MHRRNVDNLPSLSMAGHLLRRELGAEEGALEVHGQHPIVIVLGHFEERSLDLDAGVIDEDVQTAEPTDRLADQPTDVVELCDVCLHGRHAPPDRLDLLSHRVGSVTTMIYADISSVGRQAERDCPSLRRQRRRWGAPDPGGMTVYNSNGGDLMPDFTGVNHIALTVRDLPRSVAWYTDLLSLQKVGELPDEGGRGAKVLLRHPASGLVIVLCAHKANPGEPFSEFRTGLDHLSFTVRDRAELDAWQVR